MASHNLTAHIPPEASPERLLPLTELMFQENHEFPTVKSLLEFTQDRGLGSRTELQIFARACGLLKKKGGSIKLSNKAKQIAQLKKEVRADIIHYLIYTGWHENNPRQNTELWAYREVINYFWQRKAADTLDLTSLVTEEVRNKAFEMFGEDISFSAKSILGVRQWLNALLPPVMENNTFRCRHFCHPELMLLAISWVARNTEGEIGIDYLLTPERREKICRLCLLDPSALDQVLDWMLPVYSEIVQPGTSAGVYGRFILFQKWPEISDLRQ